MVNSTTLPCVKSWAVISGAGECVGPMMKSPSRSDGGTVPSGRSEARTYPGECGSRVGGSGRAVCGGGVTDAAWPAQASAADPARINSPENLIFQLMESLNLQFVWSHCDHGRQEHIHAHIAIPQKRQGVVHNVR